MEEKISQIIAGNQEAFSEIYNLYCNKVYSIAFSIVKDEFEAEDVMQEIFISLPEKLKNLKNPKRFESWLYTMARNKAIDYFRKRKNVNFSDMGYEDEEYIFEDTIQSEHKDFQPEETLDYNETQKIVQGIIESLPEEQKVCVQLRFIDGLSLQEIADKTGVPLATVKSRLKYGKSKIEAEVKALEKNGVKLYGVSGLALLPFLRWMYGKGTSSSMVTSASVGAGVSAGASVASAGASVGATVAGTATLSGLAKGLIALATTIVIAGGSTIGYFGYNEHQVNLAKEKAEQYVVCMAAGNGYIKNYYALNNGFMEYEYRLPEIANLYSQDVDEFNNDCKEKLEDITHENPDTISAVASGKIDYSAWVIEKWTPILTIAIEETDSLFSASYYFTFDLQTGNEIDKQEILSNCGFSREKINEKIIKGIEKHFEKKRNESIAYSMIYTDILEEITKKNYSESVDYYFNEYGKLSVQIGIVYLEKLPPIYITVE